MDVVEITITPTPKVESVDAGFGAHRFRLAGSESVLTPVNRIDRLTVCVLDHHLVPERLRRRVLILNFGLRRDRRAATRDVKVLRINVNTRRGEVRIERQGLMKLVRDVQ